MKSASWGTVQRFYREIIIPHAGKDCLIWPFSRNRQGRAQFYREGTCREVARVLCRDVHGLPPTDKLEAAHTCGKGHLGCVNRKHIRWKTKEENEADKLIHGTLLRGARFYATKLTEQQVLDIFSLKGIISQRKLAARYNISRRSIEGIHDGQSWGWLTSQGRKPCRAMIG